MKENEIKYFEGKKYSLGDLIKYREILDERNTEEIIKLIKIHKKDEELCNRIKNFKNRTILKRAH